MINKECINHVSKKIGTALRNKVKKWQIKGVLFCQTARNQSSLTEATINKLQKIYRNTIKDEAGFTPTSCSKSGGAPANQKVTKASRFAARVGTIPTFARAFAAVNYHANCDIIYLPATFGS